jgi:hypothetical protein
MAVEGAPVGWMQDWSAAGTGKNARVGVLLVHGFTGSPLGESFYIKRVTRFEFLYFQDMEQLLKI